MIMNKFLNAIFIRIIGKIKISLLQKNTMETALKLNHKDCLQYKYDSRKDPCSKERVKDV
jgi:hypothetical protein